MRKNWHRLWNALGSPSNGVSQVLFFFFFWTILLYFLVVVLNFGHLWRNPPTKLHTYVTIFYSTLAFTFCLLRNVRSASLPASSHLAPTNVLLPRLYLETFPHPFPSASKLTFTRLSIGQYSIVCCILCFTSSAAGAGLKALSPLSRARSSPAQARPGWGLGVARAWLEISEAQALGSSLGLNILCLNALTLTSKVGGIFFLH
jgi:hypothetical protein